MKRGQMEIIGLIMITILAGLVIVFALTYSVSNATQGQELSHETFGESVVSNNFVNVLAYTSPETCDIEYQTFVKDCIGSGGLSCDAPGGESKSSCEWMENITKEVANKTLDKWGLNYRYRIMEGDNEVWNRTHPDMTCTDEMEKEAPGRYPIVLNPRGDQAFIVLEVCKS